MAEGTIEAIYIATGKREAVIQVETAELEAGKGIVGDRYHMLAEQHLEKGLDVPANHISFVEAENLDEFMSQHELEFDYGAFRRGVITRNIDLNALVGKRFRVGAALCYGEELCEPCSYLASIIHPAVLPELDIKAGLRAVILESGYIELGDNFSLAE